MNNDYTILIVDDNADVTSLLFDYLCQCLDVDILVAKSGDAALYILDTQQINFIITDLQMSNGNGLKVVEKAREYKIEVVVYTALADAYEQHIPEDVLVLHKPTPLKDILAIISDHVYTDRPKVVNSNSA